MKLAHYFTIGFALLIICSCKQSTVEEKITSECWQVYGFMLVSPTCGGYVKRNGKVFDSNYDNTLGNVLGFTDTASVKTSFSINQNGDFSIDKNGIPNIRGNWSLQKDILLSLKSSNDTLNFEIKKITNDTLWLFLGTYNRLSNISLKLKRN